MHGAGHYFPTGLLNASYRSALGGIFCVGSPGTDKGPKGKVFGALELAKKLEKAMEKADESPIG